MADVEIIDLNPKLSPDGTELLEIQEQAGGPGSSFKTPLSNLIGPEGPQGDPGQDGADGQNATADAGVTTTLPPGSNAAVTNSGTTQDAVFDFDIPRGDVGPQGVQGDPGADGAAASADAGTTTTLAPGSDATVVNVGTTAAAVFDFGIPRGDKGDKGDQGDPGTGYNLIGSATVATLNALTAAAINTNDAYILLDSSPPDVQPIGATQPVTVAVDDLVVWAEGDYFVNYGSQAGGVSDHGALTGLADDDHLQYHNDIRGDARYYTKAQSDGNYATAAQGATADSAIQPGDNVSTLTNDANYVDQTSADAAYGIKAAEVPAGGGAGQQLVKNSATDYDMSWSTPAGGGDVSGPASSVDENLTVFDGVSGKLIKDSGVGLAKVNTALQPGDNVTELVNDAGYTSNTGDVVGPASAVDNRLATFDGVTGKLLQDSGFLVSDFASAAQGALADSAIQPGDNVSLLTNDAGYTTVGALNDLSDVTLTAPADKEGIVYNGAAWVNGFPYESGSALPAPAGYPEGFLFLVTT